MWSGHRSATRAAVAAAWQRRQDIDARRHDVWLDPPAAVDRHRPAAAEIGYVAGLVDRADAKDVVVDRDRVAHAAASRSIVAGACDDEDARGAQRGCRWGQRVRVAAFERRATP